MVWIVAAESVVYAIYAQLVLTQRPWVGLTAWAVAAGLWLWAMSRDRRLMGATRPAYPQTQETLPWYISTGRRPSSGWRDRYGV